MTDTRAYAVFTPLAHYLLIMDTGRGFPQKTVRHIKSNPLSIDGDTHVAKFYRSKRDREWGQLENTMPGCAFTHYTFERHVFGKGINAVVVIVGWYWTGEE